MLLPVGLLTQQGAVEATGDHLHQQVGSLQRLKLMQGTAEQWKQRGIPEGPAMQLGYCLWLLYSLRQCLPFEKENEPIF